MKGAYINVPRSRS